MTSSVPGGGFVFASSFLIFKTTFSLLGCSPAPDIGAEFGRVEVEGDAFSIMEDIRSPFGSDSVGRRLFLLLGGESADEDTAKGKHQRLEEQVRECSMLTLLGTTSSSCS